MPTRNQKRVCRVLTRLADLASEDEEIADALMEPLEAMCEDLSSSDLFGTEGQHDPRGDQREDNWTLDHVEGVDA